MADWEYEDDVDALLREVEDMEMQLYKADDPTWWGHWYGYESKKG
jgi:hypothetical protein